MLAVFHGGGVGRGDTSGGSEFAARGREEARRARVSFSLGREGTENDMKKMKGVWGKGFYMLDIPRRLFK